MTTLTSGNISWRIKSLTRLKRGRDIGCVIDSSSLLGDMLPVLHTLGMEAHSSKQSCTLHKYNLPLNESKINLVKYNKSQNFLKFLNTSEGRIKVFNPNMKIYWNYA